jgi:hypothetical protein
MGAAADDAVPYVPHAEFKAGLAHGHFRVVVNPELSRRFVVHVTRANYLALALIGVGAALALAKAMVAGGVLVALGMALNRLVRHQAARILLHLAQRNEAVYDQATTHGVMEVQRA